MSGRLADQTMRLIATTTRGVAVAAAGRGVASSARSAGLAGSIVERRAAPTFARAWDRGIARASAAATSGTDSATRGVATRGRWRRSVDRRRGFAAAAGDDAKDGDDASTDPSLSAAAAGSKDEDGDAREGE